MSGATSKQLAELRRLNAHLPRPPKSVYEASTLIGAIRAEHQRQYAGGCDWGLEVVLDPATDRLVACTLDRHPYQLQGYNIKRQIPFPGEELRDRLRREAQQLREGA